MVITGSQFNRKEMTAFDAVDFNRQMSAAGWDLEFLSLEKAPARLYVEAVQSPSLIIQKASFSGRLRQLGASPKGFITVGLATDYNDNLLFANRCCGSNDLLSFNTGAGLDAVTERGYQAYTLSILHDELEKCIETLQLTATRIEEFNSKSLSTAQPPFQKKLQVTLEQVFEIARSEASHEAFIEESDIISLFLETWSNQSTARRYQYAGSSSRIRKVVDYIQENLNHTLAIDSVCRECAVGRKTLERDFNRHFGIGPKGYINLLKLAAIRRQLLAGNNHLSIHEIASSWGFSHMSKFAADYRKVFGELPSVTRDLRY